MKLEVGKYYQRADGHKAGPAWMESPEKPTPLPWCVESEGGRHYYYPDGRSCVDDQDARLIAEWTDTPTTGTLAELNVKPGDVVENEFEPNYHYEVRTKDGVRALWNTEYGYWGVYVEDSFQTYTIISRASDEPTFDPLDPPAFGELTDAQKVDIMLHFSRGGVTEFWSECHGMWKSAQRLSFYNDTYYRKKPEPKRETVTMYWGADNGFADYRRIGDTHKIQVDFLDGKPVCDSIKMEEL